MKKNLIVLFFLLAGIKVFAQGIIFEELSFNQALEKAKVENKLVFLDCYTSWCGPCKGMLDNVFSLDKAGEYFNPRFINLKIDMEKGEGRELAKRYSIKAYPTFLLLRSDGAVQHRIVGGASIDDFIEKIARGSQKSTSLLYSEEGYQSGKRKPTDLLNYYLALQDASEKTKLKEIALELFNLLSPKEKVQKRYWPIYNHKLIFPNEDYFQYLVDNKSKFDKQIGKEIVDNYLYNSYSDFFLYCVNHYNTYKHAPDVLETIILAKSQLRSIETEKKDALGFLCQYTINLYKHDLEGLLDITEKGLKEYPNISLVTTLFSLTAKPDNKSYTNRLLSLKKHFLDDFDNVDVKDIISNYFVIYDSILTVQNNYTEIQGVVKREKMKLVNLYEVNNGMLNPLATTKVGDNGLYGFIFEPSQTGFYVIGDKDNQYRLYLKKGDWAGLDILEDRVELSKNNNEENRLLYKWEELFDDVRKRVTHNDYIFFDHQQFLPYFADFLPEAKAFTEKINTSNEEFNELLRKTINFDLKYNALRFATALKFDKKTHQFSKFPYNDCPEYYKDMVATPLFTNPDVLAMPYGVDFLDIYTIFNATLTEKDYSLDNKLSYLPCDLLKAELVLKSAANFKSYNQYTLMLDKYSSLFTNDSHKYRLDILFSKLFEATPGVKAIDFTYPDKDGKLVSLSDFKGKVVVIDVWATWCGPCRKEIPHLIELEKAMHGKDVVFIGISTDAKKDKQKWLDFLVQEKLDGIQLLAGPTNKLSKNYKIEYIPRFMVFDKNGDIVSANAPRPSDPKLKEMINKELKK